MQRINGLQKSYYRDMPEAQLDWSKYTTDLTEKIDGSQFSFCSDGQTLFARSKNRMIDIDNPDPLFAPSVAHLLSIKDKLEPNIIYRAEALKGQKQNNLRYDREPKGNMVLFGLMTSNGHWLSYSDTSLAASDLDIDVVPLFAVYKGRPPCFDSYMQADSFLGGCKIEGVVAHARDDDGNVVFIKNVSEAFKESMISKSHKRVKDTADKIQDIIDSFRLEGRWNKAIQHLREDGKLKHSPQDIGPLLKEINIDFEAECMTAAMHLLWDKFGKKIKRGVCAGFGDYYKKKFLEETE